MAQKHIPDVPVGEIEGVADSIEGIAKIYQIDAQVRRDTVEYELTESEAEELKSAYYREDTSGVLHDLERQLINTANRYWDGQQLRSSYQILKAAQERQLKKKEGLEQEAIQARRASISPDYMARFYIWRCQMDDKVRLSHLENHGKIFSWDERPPGGHPGEAYGCRCFAQPLYSPDAPVMRPQEPGNDVWLPPYPWKPGGVK